MKLTPHPYPLGNCKYTSTEGGGDSTRSLPDHVVIDDTARLHSIRQHAVNRDIRISAISQASYGWKPDMDSLMEMAATATDERVGEPQDLLDVAIAVNEGKEQAFILAQ